MLVLINLIFTLLFMTKNPLINTTYYEQIFFKNPYCKIYPQILIAIYCWQLVLAPRKRL